jgi:hypothetical protein
MYIKRLIVGLLTVSGILLAVFILYSIPKSRNEIQDVAAEEVQVNVMGSTVHIPTDSLFKVDGLKSNMVDTLDMNFRFISYVDSSSCSTCAITKSRVWDGIVAMTRKHNIDVQPIFILHPSASKINDLIMAINSSRIKFDIYIDTLGAFRHANEWITQNGSHTVLTDKNHRIVFVGDPTDSEITQGKYFDFIVNL